MQSFDEFVDTLREIHQEGWVETHRNHNTGVGKTLEDKLGITENNIPGPDAVGLELKATRKDSGSLTTLFTKEPPKDRRPLWGQEMIRELGYIDSKDRPALKVTIKPDTPNNQGFYLDYDSDSVSIMHDEAGECATYPLDYLQERFEEKFPALVMVFADSKDVDGTEYFLYSEAYLLDGFNPEAFLDLMRDGAITLDIRMHLKESGANRNRGTAWRINDESRLNEAFEERTPLLNDTAVEDIPAPEPQDAVPDDQEKLDDY
jgi:hypothetical protein